MTCRATGLMWLSLRLLFILLSDSSPSPPSWPPMRNHTLCSSLFTSPSSSSFSSALVLLLSINLNPPSPSPLWTEEGGSMDGWRDGCDCSSSLKREVEIFTAALFSPSASWNAWWEGLLCFWRRPVNRKHVRVRLQREHKHCDSFALTSRKLTQQHFISSPSLQNPPLVSVSMSTWTELKAERSFKDKR